MKVSIFAVAAIAGSLLIAGTATANDKYRDASRQLVGQADMALRTDDAETALTLYERALVANPANVQALIGLGKTHEIMGRVGRGLKYYRQALTVDPNALVALEAQAVAFLKRDMIDRAEANRARLARLCAAGCGPLDNVETALEAYKAEKAQADMADASAGGE